MRGFQRYYTINCFTTNFDNKQGDFRCFLMGLDE